MGIPREFPTFNASKGEAAQAEHFVIHSDVGTPGGDKGDVAARRGMMILGVVGWVGPWTPKSFQFVPYIAVSKNRGVSPQIIHFNRVFPLWTIHFGVPLFLETPIYFVEPGV